MAIELTTASESQINAIRASLSAVSKSEVPSLSTIAAVSTLVRDNSAYWNNTASVLDPIFNTNLTYIGQYKIGVKKSIDNTGTRQGELNDFANTSSTINSGAYVSLAMPTIPPVNANNYYLNILQLEKLKSSNLNFLTLTGFSMPDLKEIMECTINFNTPTLKYFTLYNLENIYSSNIVFNSEAICQLNEISFPKLKNIIASNLILGGYVNGGYNQVTSLTAIRFPKLVYSDYIIIGSASFPFFPFLATPLTGVRVLDFSELEFANRMELIRLDGLERLNFPKLKTLGTLGLTPFFKLSSANFPMLENLVGGYAGNVGVLVEKPYGLNPVMPLTGIHMPNLKIINGVQAFSVLHCPFLQHVNLGFDTLARVNLNTINFSFDEGSLGLNVESVDGILRGLSRTADNNNCTIGGYVLMSSPCRPPSFSGTVKNLTENSLAGRYFNSSFTMVTATLINHGFNNNNYVTISDSTQARFNGTFTLSTVDSNTFTFLIGGSNRLSEGDGLVIAGYGQTRHTTNTNEGFYYFQNLAFKTGRPIAISLPSIL